MTDKTLTIRPADLADLAAVDRLAELWAAVEVDSGAAIADPFRPSSDLVDLLRAHAEPRPERRSLKRLLPRLA